MRRLVNASDALRRMQRASDEAKLAQADTGADRAQYIGAPAWYILGGDLTPINSPLSLLKFQAKDAPPQEYTVVLAPVRRSVSLQSNVNLAGNASTPPFFPTRLGAFGVTAANVNDGSSIVRVRWGDGRVGQEAWFAYPAAGAVFSLRATSIDIDVAPTDDQDWSSQEEAPAFAASLFPGAYADPTPLWFSYESPVAISSGTFRDYAIPPFARYARVSDSASSLQTWRADQINSAGTIVEIDFRSVTAASQTLSAFDVPLVANARTLRINNVTASLEVIGVQFRIGLG